MSSTVEKQESTKLTGRPYDVAIIGGGIVGLATAHALLTENDLSLVLLEAEATLAAHQTGHNSGVIHSGLYYKPGSLKAQNCTAGREDMYRFCEKYNIKHERCGKIVVATEPGEIPALDNLESRGRANGLTGIRRLGPEQIKEHEPYVTGLAGLLVPETGIVDYKGVANAMGRLIEERGGLIRKQARFRSFRRLGSEMVLGTTQGDVVCRHLINCGGLQSDRVARLCGVDPGLQIIPFRGEYYELTPQAKHLVRNLIYPVPDPRFPFLGVHFTRCVNGMTEAGPNAVLALRREGYGRLSFSPRDTLQLLAYSGFWRMAWKYAGTGMKEVYRSFSKKAFLRALQRLIADLKYEDIHPAGSGVRAQAVDPSGALVDDFRFVQAEGMIHVLNAPSPAATASLSIGRAIAAKAREGFSLTVAKVA
jgi:L-2-hydroxyglutarate oxidase